MGFPKVGNQALDEGGIMQVGSLYSCKWTPFHSNDERGWDMLMFLGVDTDKQNGYVFFDLIHGARRHLSEGLIRHCKEINKETTCTR